MRKEFSNPQIKKVITNIVYPENTAQFISKIPNMEGIHRNPETYKGDRKGNLSKFYSEKCKRTIVCESDQERGLFEVLETSNEVIWYQEQPMKIKYEINGKVKYYYPDVAVLFDDGKGAILEVKTNAHMLRKDVLEKSIMAQKYLNNLGIGFGIIDKYGRSYRFFIRSEADKDYEKAVLTILGQKGFILVSEFQSISKEYNKDSTGKTWFPGYGNLLVKHDLYRNVKLQRYERLPENLSYKSFF